MAIAAESNTKVWWQDYRHLLHGGFDSYLELESYATDFRIYHSLVVPGLLQTADYARAVFRSFAPEDPASEIDKRVQMRMQRRTRIMQRRWKSQLNSFCTRGFCTASSAPNGSWLLSVGNSRISAPGKMWSYGSCRSLPGSRQAR
jgi:hypothetical protein